MLSLKTTGFVYFVLNLTNWTFIDLAFLMLNYFNVLTKSLDVLCEAFLLVHYSEPWPKDTSSLSEATKNQQTSG